MKFSWINSTQSWGWGQYKFATHWHQLLGSRGDKAWQSWPQCGCLPLAWCKHREGGRKWNPRKCYLRCFSRENKPPWNKLLLNLICETVNNICQWGSRKIILTEADAEKDWYLQDSKKREKSWDCLNTVNDVSVNTEMSLYKQRDKYQRWGRFH